MSTPKTLLQMAGVEPHPNSLSNSVLIVIDAQNEYLDGALALPAIAPALDQIAALQARARAAETPLLHVQHVGRPGSLFDVTAHGGQLIDAVSPDDDELIVRKTLPNAFAHTDLDTLLDDIGRKHLIICGFMTHMCVSATARAAIDHAYISTVVGAACATRDLPDPITGATIPAEELHRNSLAALSDRFATVARTADDIPD